jgi:hypothetical protein
MYFDMMLGFLTLSSSLKMASYKVNFFGNGGPNVLRNDSIEIHVTNNYVYFRATADFVGCDNASRVTVHLPGVASFLSIFGHLFHDQSPNGCAWYDFNWVGGLAGVARLPLGHNIVIPGGNNNRVELVHIVPERLA